MQKSFQKVDVKVVNLKSALEDNFKLNLVTWQNNQGEFFSGLANDYGDVIAFEVRNRFLSHDIVRLWLNNLLLTKGKSFETC